MIGRIFKNSAYTPVAHSDIWRDQELIRTGVAALFSGKAGLPVVTYAPGEAIQPHAVPPAADVAIGHASTLLSHLTNASWRAGNVTLRYDAETESFPDTPAANAYLARTYRSPWSLPAV